MAECLEFHRQEHMEIFLQIFSGLSSYATTGPSARYNVHELSLFLLAELFAREAQRPDTNECWPEPAAIDTPSPIKLGSKSPLGTPRSAMRIQLQQHVKQQQHIMKNYGDYIRRNLGAVLSLLQDVPPPPPTPELVSGGGSMRLTAHQLDRASFLIHVADSTPEAGARPLSANCAPLYQGASPQAAQATSDVVALLRQQWHTDRFDSLFGALLGGAGRGGNGSTTPTMQPPAASPRPPFGIKAEPGMDVDGGGSGSHPPPLLSPPPQHRLKHEHQHAAAASSSTSSSAYGAMSPGTATHNPPQTVDRSLGMVASAGHVDRSAIQGVHKGSVIRGEGDLEPSLRILDCHDCFIYLLAPLQVRTVLFCAVLQLSAAAPTLAPACWPPAAP